MDYLRLLKKTTKGPGNMKLKEVPIPKPEDNEVLIEIKAAGIYGMDIQKRGVSLPLGRW